MPSSSLSPPSSEKSEPRQSASVSVPGIGVSAGIAIGRALVVGQESPPGVVETELQPQQVAVEVRRFRAAVRKTHRQIAGMRQRLAGILGEHDARVFDAHLLLVQDKLLVDEVAGLITSRRRNAAFLFCEVVQRYAKAFENVDDPYLRDRLTDIQDVANRVLSNLRGGRKPVDLSHLPEPCVLIAQDLSPSDTADMDRHQVLGFATCVGSRTSHTAIMARALGIPAVVAAVCLRDRVRTGDWVVLDGLRGQVIVNPTAAEIRQCRRRLRQQDQWIRNVEAEALLPCETLDGFRVQLAANVELPEEVAAVKLSHGVGIGLFRTEYLFINRSRVPDEEEQFAAYRRVAEDIYPQSVILRTLDLGGDKFMSHVKMAGELNPFLGTRAIRFCLAQPDIFRAQIRAILRASAFGKVRILFPMISTLDELEQALAHLDRAKKDLASARVPFNRHLDVGTMIEVPSAALLADRLAPRVDFFSLGTNDLVQYTLAADRSNPDVAHLYQPCHPSILRLIRMVLEAAWTHGKWVSICGEMAADPVFTPLVLGLGIHELSMSPVALGPVRHLVRHLHLHQAETLVRRSLACGTAEEVRALCEGFLRRSAPDLLPATGRRGSGQGR